MELLLILLALYWRFGTDAAPAPAAPAPGAPAPGSPAGPPVIGTPLGGTTTADGGLYLAGPTEQGALWCTTAGYQELLSVILAWQLAQRMRPDLASATAMAHRHLLNQGCSAEQVQNMSRAARKKATKEPMTDQEKAVIAQSWQSAAGGFGILGAAAGVVS